LNTLSYGLLSILTVHPYSGYDLMLKIHQFWQAKHSQIYPLLAELEREGLVQYELVQQSNKPDKKVYSITELGEAAVKSWLKEPTAEPVTRDEFTLKLFCISISDPASAKQLLLEREAMYRNKVSKLENALDQLRDITNVKLDNIGPHSKYFGAYILIQRSIMTAKTNLEWCEWVLQTWMSPEIKPATDESPE
jgi:PadR family transcriptional regulator, regulatory protein AphA